MTIAWGQRLFPVQERNDSDWSGEETRLLYQFLVPMFFTSQKYLIRKHAILIGKFKGITYIPIYILTDQYLLSLSMTCMSQEILKAETLEVGVFSLTCANVHDHKKTTNTTHVQYMFKTIYLKRRDSPTHIVILEQTSLYMYTN